MQNKSCIVLYFCNVSAVGKPSFSLQTFNIRINIDYYKAEAYAITTAL